jgi:hypothetical protein
VGERDWDASVKSLAAFPQVLAMMDQQLEWTARLGDVFIAQEPQVMETVQNLRQKAYDAGNLRSTEQATVSRQGEAFAIEPVSPEIVYVPYYDPRVAYGSWWWPAYPPVYWAPWPGYYAYPGYPVGFAWGPGIIVSSGFFFSTFNWHQRHVTIVNVTVNRQVIVNRPGLARTAPVVWQHDPGHRRGVPYHIESVRQRFGGSPQAGQRRDFRWQGPLAPATRNSSLNRPEVRGADPRPNAPGMERPNPRRDGRPDGRSLSANPGAAARPESHGPVTRPPVAAVPQVHPGAGKVPHVQGPAPQPGHNPRPQGFTNQGQAGNHPAPGAAKAHGEGRR